MARQSETKARSNPSKQRAQSAEERPEARRAKSESSIPPAPSQSAGVALDLPTRHAKIAEAAYYLAEKRGFAPGNELEDWCEAESRLDQSSSSGSTH
jgi:hypothetical protein